MTVHQWLAEWSSWGWPLLANHLWQATLISLVAFAAAGLLRNGPGRARYSLWLIASATFVLPTALAVRTARTLGIDFSSLLGSKDGSRDAVTTIFQITTPIAQIDDSMRAAQRATGHSELFCALTAVWLVGIVILLAVWLSRRLRFRLVLRETNLAEPMREKQALDRVRSWIVIKQDVQLSILPGTVEPGVWGVWRPRVFLPQSMAEGLSEAELEAVLMHEMIHVARKDNLIANLHRGLCCIFWFHPFVWILDRLLLAERERACDEEVIRLGGAADVYASSLLKVLRFCLGWNVAGASNATGSNLGRRVERIMSANIQLKLSVWHRVAIGSTAALVIVLSMAAGLLTRNGVGAQNAPTRAGGIGGVTERIPAGADQERLIERLDQAPAMAIEFRNSDKAPIVIHEASVKAVPREKDGPGDEFAVIPIVSLTNNTDRRIRGLTFEFSTAFERRVYFERAAPQIEPNGVYTSGGAKRLVFLVGRPESWTLRVSGVVFSDGEVWGDVPPPPPPPPPPTELKILEGAPEIIARFDNVQGAPLSILSATVKSAQVERSRESTDSEDRYLVRLFVRLANNTSRRITGVAIEFGKPDSKDNLQTYVSTKIEPYATYSLETPSADVSRSRVFFLRGNPDQKEVRVIGALFEDGEQWGSFPPPPPPPPAPPQVIPASSDAKLIRKSGGVLAQSATHRVVPDSPPLARAARISGSVVVEVTLDEDGTVIAARAISGHPLLKDAAVNAARQWRFNQTLLTGVPVRVIGTLTFNFEP